MQMVTLSDGRSLAVAEWGDPAGVPVLRFHGTPGCRLNRPSEEARLRDIGVRIVAYDRPGYGMSSRDPGRSVVDCVADVLAIADALGIEQFVATGNSGGGPHVLALAARAPERVLRVQCSVCVAPFDADGLNWFDGVDPENVREIGWALEGEERLTAELSREATLMQERVANDPAQFLPVSTFPRPTSRFSLTAGSRM